MQNHYIGIDLGGTLIKMGLSDGMDILDECVFDARSSAGLEPALPAIEDQIDLFLTRNRIGQKSFMGVAAAFPGIVDHRAKKIISTNEKYTDAIELDLKRWVYDKWKVPFYIDNDARMAALGEWKLGMGKGCDNLIAVTIGTGFGTGVVMEGKLVRGKHFQAGILGGHFTLNRNGGICQCGNIGCVESEISSWILGEKIRQDPQFTQSVLYNEPKLDFKALFNAAMAGDPLALQLKDDSLKVWAAALVNLIHAYDPELVVLNGGVLNVQQEIVPFLKHYIHKHTWCPWGDVDIKVSELRSKAALLGGVLGLIHNI
jgi:glucokinase